MSELGQTEKNSVRAYVFRFALELGHGSTQSAAKVQDLEVADLQPTSRIASHASRCSSSRSEPAHLGLIEIDLGNRLRIRVDAQVNAEALARALRLAHALSPDLSVRFDFLFVE